MPENFYWNVTIIYSSGVDLLHGWGRTGSKKHLASEFFIFIIWINNNSVDCNNNNNNNIIVTRDWVSGDGFYVLLDHPVIVFFEIWTSFFFFFSYRRNTTTTTTVVIPFEIPIFYNTPTVVCTNRAPSDNL